MSDTLRNAELADLAKVLEGQRARTLDVVAPARDLRVSGGLLVVKGVEAQLSEDGVTQANGLYRPTLVGDEGLADKLGIPLAYLRRLHTDHLPLYDANVNGWLERSTSTHLLRMLRVEQADQLPLGDPWRNDGVLRAFLSDRYRTIDNFDVVMAALTGVQQAGIDPSTLEVKADLTERRMYVRVTSDAITANALALVRDYQDPGTGRRGREYPLMSAGFVISNSEVGQGGFTVTPRVVLQVCKNGQTMTKDAARTVHVGGRLEEGTIEWSEDTQRKQLALITAKTADTVRAFMSQRYVQAKADELAAAAGVKIEHTQQVIAQVSQRMGFSKAQADSILNAFIDGGDRTAGGVMHAVTWVAQQADDGDTAAELEGRAVEALQAAASLALARR